MKNIHPITFCLLVSLGLFYIQIHDLSAQTFEWVQQIGYSNSNSTVAVWSSDSDKFENVYITGIFSGKIDFDPGPDSVVFTSKGDLPPNGGTDMFVLKLDDQGNLLWAKQYGGTNVDQARSIEVDPSGNVYVTGHFQETIEFDPENGTATFNSAGETDQFILKLDTDGEFIWARQMVGMYRGYSLDLALDNGGNVYSTGSFEGIVDFDPGNGTANLTAKKRNIFVLKLDSSGNYLWAKNMKGALNSFGASITTDFEGNVITTGVFKGTVDFDPGMGVFELVDVWANGGAFIQKLDPDGNLLWAGSMGGTGTNYGNSVSCDDLGNVYTAGIFEETVDFDPGNGTTNLTSIENEDIFIQKLDTSGNLVWVKQLEGNSGDVSILLDDFGHIYTTGTFIDTLDLYPGPGSVNFISAGQNDMFVLKMNTDGDFLWAQQVGSDMGDGGASLAVNPKGEIYFSGIFGGKIDVDPGDDDYELTPLGNGDVFVTKWSQGICDNMGVVIDSISGVLCSRPGSISSHAINGFPPYSYTWNTEPIIEDSLGIFLDPGTYTLNVRDNIGCARSVSILVEGPTSQNQVDLFTNLITTEFRSGFPTSIWIDAFNKSCTPSSGQIILALSPNVTFDNASLPPDLIQGDTLIWNYSNLNYDSGHIKIQVFLKTILGLTLNDKVCFDLTMSPFDYLPAAKANNIKDYCFPIIGSYDPNDIKVYPVGECEVGYIEPDQKLTYTVRFQNTGNADAINVFILDKLDKSLDLKTLKILGQSHEPMIPEILEDDVLKFRFDSIHLPDSNTNEPESHGYVIFEVSPLPNLSPGTVIENQVGIYFDFNDPVLTNTVSNTIFEELDTTVVQTENFLTAQATQASYQWMDCRTDLAVQNERERIFEATENGEYYVNITRHGCIYRSACFSVTNFESNDKFGSNMRFFPIPATENLTIDLGERIPEGTIELFSLTGQVSLRQPIENQRTMELDIAHIPSGVFFVKITSQGKLAAFKVMKE